MAYHAKVIAGGKIVIPADLRRELGIKDGDSVVMEREPHGISLRREEPHAALTRVREPSRATASISSCVSVAQTGESEAGRRCFRPTRLPAG